MAGYSGRPLHAKLGWKPGAPVVLLNAPDDYDALLGGDVPALGFTDAPYEGCAATHLFTTARDDLAQVLPRLLAVMARDGMIWVSWPKKSAKLETDVTEDTIRAIALPLGLVDVKVCAVSNIWSGLKLVIRKELR